MSDARPQPASLWTGRHLRTTVGLFALAFMFAFEALAVATVMPDVADELDGLALYAVAFAAPMATSVVAYVVAGPWNDRSGPRPAIDAGVVVFVVGLLIAGLAPTMPVLLAGRIVQGLGMGLVGVAMYVVVAHAYPTSLRARAFTVLSAAWVLPALVGPTIAAVVADGVGWRWVFLGVPLIVGPAWWLVHDAAGSARGADRDRGSAHPGGAKPSVLRACVTAVAVLLVSLAGQRHLPLWPAVLAAAVVVTLAAGRGLLPAGTWTGRRGLPSVIGTRGLVIAAFAGAEAYLPLLLTLHRGLTLTQAGVVLTSGAVTWSVGSWLAANWRALADEVWRARLGIVLLSGGIALFAAGVATEVPLAVPVVGWAFAGTGIGIAFATLSVLTLARAEPGEEGRASSALQLNDALVQALVLAVGSAVFAGFAERAPATGATVLVVAAAVLAGVSLLPAARLR